MFGIKEIIDIVPHRYPFLLIDRILEFEPDRFVKAVKNVTVNEPCFPGHFPGKPVYPGVYIIEAMAQSACFLLIKSRKPAGGEGLFGLAKVKNFSITKPVLPGDSLVTQIEVIKRTDTMAMVKALGLVENEEVARGELFFGLLKDF